MQDLSKEPTKESKFVDELNGWFQEAGHTEMTARLKYNEVHVSGTVLWDDVENFMQSLSDKATEKGIQINTYPPTMGGAGGRTLAFLMDMRG